jgi:hypothetical protein
MADEYRQKFIKLEREHIYMMDNQKELFQTAKYETETALTSQIKRLEYLNKKQLESFDQSLNDKEDYISDLIKENDQLKTRNE